MSEYIEIIKNAFLNYYADQKYFIIFLVALVAVFVYEKRIQTKNLLLYFPLIAFIVLFNPMFVYGLSHFISENIYYRFFWTIPLGIVIAYLGVVLVARMDKKLTKNVAAILFILLIVYSGKFMYVDETFVPVSNWYKLPDEYVQITQMLSDVPIQDKKAMTSTDMIGYIRQLDASIKLAYSRVIYEEYEKRYPIVKYYNQGDVKNLVEICQQQNINIIIYDKNISLSQPLSDYGYHLYNQTENYDIYTLGETKVSEMNIDEETIKIEGIQGNYRLCFINDLHIIVPDDEVKEENKQIVQQRYNDLFKTAAGEASLQLWKRIPSQINALESDLVILGGDMLDYISSSNIAALQEGMQEIKQEKIYLRADHDYGTHYNPELTKEYVTSLHKTIDENLGIYYQDLGEIIVVGIDNNTALITTEVLSSVKENFCHE